MVVGAQGSVASVPGCLWAKLWARSGRSVSPVWWETGPLWSRGLGVGFPTWRGLQRSLVDRWRFQDFCIHAPTFSVLCGFGFKQQKSVVRLPQLFPPLLQQSSVLGCKVALG